MSKFIILGDVHLGKGLSIGRSGIGSNLNSRIIDQVKLLNWTLQQAIENHVTTIFITGDICEDSKPDYRLINIFLDWLRDCHIAGIFVHIIGGNHDIKRTGQFIESYLDIIDTSGMEGVIFHKDIVTISLDDVHVTIVPYRDLRMLESASNEEAKQFYTEQIRLERDLLPENTHKVLIGHLAIEGSLYVGDEVDDLLNELIFSIDSFPGYDHVWMGHVHKPQVRSKKPYVAHIGSMDLSDFGEIDHEKIIILYESGSFKELKVPSRPLRKILIEVDSEGSSTEFVLKYLDEYNTKNSLEDSLLKLDIKLMNQDISKINRKVIEQKLKELKVYNIASFIESRIPRILSSDNQVSIDTTTDTSTAIKLWADYRKMDDAEKSEYIRAANLILEKFKERSSGIN